MRSQVALMGVLLLRAVLTPSFAQIAEMPPGAEDSASLIPVGSQNEQGFVSTGRAGRAEMKTGAAPLTGSVETATDLAGNSLTISHFSTFAPSTKGPSYDRDRSPAVSGHRRQDIRSTSFPTAGSRLVDNPDLTQGASCVRRSDRQHDQNSRFECSTLSGNAGCLNRRAGTCIGLGRI
jgi:hypothetical protein